MRIELGTVVRDKVTGFVGVVENRASFLYGCDRYCVQPKVGEDGKIPESAMIDEPQLEATGELSVMNPPEDPKMLVGLGSFVDDPIRGIGGTVIGRAVYLNGCSRILIQPKQKDNKNDESWWVDEQQVVLVIRNSEVTSVKSVGGPVPSSSKY